MSWSRSLGESSPEPRDPEELAEIVEAEVPELGDARTRVFRNSDGTLTVQAYLTPINYETPEGWRRISNAIEPDPRREGWVGTSGNAWSVSFGPVDDGVRLAAPEGTLRMTPMRSSGAEARRPEVVASPERPRPMSAREAISEPAIPEPGVVRYERVWPDADLRYEVLGHGLKEDIRLLSSEASSRFAFEIAGAEFDYGDDGGLEILGELGERFQVPPPSVIGADDSDLTEDSGVRFILGPDTSRTSRITVAVDRLWLRRQPERVFPLSVDPSFFDAVQAGDVVTVDSEGARSTSTTIGTGIQGGVARRAAVSFPQYEQWLDQGYRVYNANLWLVKQDSSSAPSTLTAYDQGPVDPATVPFSAIGTDRPVAGSTPSTQVVDINEIDASRTVDGWYAQALRGRWFGIRGSEDTVDSLHLFDVLLNLNVYTPPEPSRVTNLTADQVLSTTTPTLQAQEIPPTTEFGVSSGSEHLVYDFQITTSPAPGAGLVVSSGEKIQDLAEGDPPPSWTVPEGTLQEGVTYYAWVLTDWPFNKPEVTPKTVPPPSWGVPFTVDLGLGEGGSSPTDEVGAVPGRSSTPSEGAPNPSLPPSKVTANLVNGNASIAVDTPKLETVSGGLGLRFTYNSLAATAIGLNGVQGSYYNDANDNGVIDPGVDPLVAQRVDPTVSFDLGAMEAAVAGQDPNRALAEWTGFLSLQPSGHTWKLGAISSDGITIRSGSTVLLDDSTSHAPQPEPTFGESFTPTGEMPITINWHHSSSDPQVARVFAQDQSVVDEDGEHPIYAIDPSWLTRSPKVLPAGWTLNAAATSGRWVSLMDRGSSVTVYSGDGSGYEFKATGDGKYLPPSEAPTDELSVNGEGQFVLRSGNLTYTFGPTGALVSLVTTADDRDPAALLYGYEGSPPQLRTITDPVRCADASPCPAGSQVTLSYGGDPDACSGVPSGLLCRIRYWDGTSTTLTYDGSGRLARITNPGDVVYDFAYDGEGNLTDVRDPLANAAISAGVRADDETARTQLTYDDHEPRRVSTITQPAPSSGASRPQRLYCYEHAKANSATMTCEEPVGKTSSVGVVGFEPTVGFARQVKYDDRNRIIASSDSAGLTTTFKWDDSDRLVAKIDPGGIETSRSFDTLGHLIAEYGPAPASSFEDDGLPKAGASVPTTSKSYDEGIDGLAAAWYPNPDLRGNATYHTTSSLGEDWSGACDSPSSCDGAGGLVPGEGFSGRLTGQVTLPEPGRISLDTNGGQVFLDDDQVIDQRDGPYASAVRPDRPISWWRLSESPGTPTASDSAGGDAGGYSSGVSLGGSGPLAGDDNTVASFDGSSDTVAVSDSPSLRFERTQPFSVEMWIKTSDGSGYRALVSKLDVAAPARGWEVSLDGGKPRFILVNTWSSNAISRTAQTVIADGGWHHLVVSYDGSSQAAGVSFYIDGNLDGATTGLDSLTGTTITPDDVTLASRQADIFWFPGSLADVAIYPKALVAAEVTEHYDAAAQTSAAASSSIIYNTPYPGEVVDDSPIAYWRLDDDFSTTATDSAGSNSGTYSIVGLTPDQPGPLAGDPAEAVEFDGSIGSVYVPDSPTLRFNQRQPFSVEVWFKTTDASAYQVLASKLDAASPFTGWELGVTNQGKPYLYLVNTWGSNAIVKTGATGLADGAWHHLVATYDGSSKAAGVRFFVDGRPDGPVSGQQVLQDSLTADPTGTAGLAIGSRDGEAHWFDGTIAEVAVYPDALAGRDAVARYAAALAPYPLAVEAGGPVSYWRLGEASKTTAFDRTGANPGTYSSTGCSAASNTLVGDENGATSFDGAACTVSVPDSPGLRFAGSQPFTVETWMKTTPGTEGQVLASKMANAAPFQGWELGLGAAGEPYLLLVDTWGSNAIAKDWPTSVADGSWHHLVVTYDGSATGAGVRLFVDGQLAGGGNVSQDTLTGDPRSSAPLAIGSRDADVGWFAGTMSDSAIYLRELNAEEIAAHHTAGQTAPPDPEPVHRITVEMQQIVPDGHLNLTTDAAGATFGPNYGFLTTETDPDGKVTQTRYSDPASGIEPKFGVATATILDPGGLALETATTYESPGAGGFLRRVGKTLPAGNETTYENYAGDEGPIAAVCGVDANTPQAGLTKQRTDPTPANGAARVEQYVYDERGRQVGHRIGATATISSVEWACTTYDAQGRMTSQSWPAFDGQPARTVTYTYAVGGNPLINEVGDTEWPNRAISSTVDLLGRTVGYTDIWGHTTTTSYDQAGRVTDTDGPVGDRHTAYDAAGRVLRQQLDGETLAEPTYDPTTGLLSEVSYPDGSGNGGNGTHLSVGYDDAMRKNALTFTTPGGGLLTSDETTLSPAGRITSEVIDGDTGSPSTFTYDGAGRLTQASVPGHDLTYNYTPTGGCGPLATAGANTNRTSLVDNGQTTTYCYDDADRLISSSDPDFATAAYDDHGNTTTLGDQTLTFDAADRHVRTVSAEGGQQSDVSYVRDPLDRIVERQASSYEAIVPRTPGTANTGASTASNLTIPQPAATTEGDLLVAEVTWTTSAGIPSLTPPAGWTHLSTGSANTVSDAVFYRIASAAEPADYTFTFSAPTTAAGAVMGYGGVDANTPIADRAVASTSTTRIHVAPSVTTTGPYDLLLVTMGTNNEQAITPDPQMTERWEQSTAAAVGNRSNAGADELIPNPGPTGTRTFTTANIAGAVLHSIVIRPQRLPARGVDVVETSTVNSGALAAGSLEIPAPEGTVADDLLVAQVTWLVTAGLPNLTPPAGWTQLNTRTNGSTRDAVYYKVEPDPAASYTFTFSSPALAAGAIVSLRGADPDHPIETHAVATATNAGTHVAPSVTTSSPNDLLLVTIGTDNKSAITADPATTERWQQSTDAATGNRSQHGATQALPTPGATGTRTLQTAMAGASITRSIAIRANPTTLTRYGHTGHEDAPALELDRYDDVLTRTIALEGGVILTRRGASASPEDTWSYPNLLGDIAATADGNGAKFGSTFTWDPYGQPLSGQPDNTTSAFAYGWKGEHRKFIEGEGGSATIQMGARPYSPTLGRFLAVDPIEGGCANDYMYVGGDPLNSHDLSGRFKGFRWWAKELWHSFHQGKRCVDWKKYGAGVLTTAVGVATIHKLAAEGSFKVIADYVRHGIAPASLGEGLLSLGLGKEAAITLGSITAGVPAGVGLVFESFKRC